MLVICAGGGGSGAPEGNAELVCAAEARCGNARFAKSVNWPFANLNSIGDKRLPWLGLVK